MSVLKAFFIAVSTYTALPVPSFKWEERSLKWAVCFFPLTGALLGALYYGLCLLCGAYIPYPFVFACLSVCLPLLFTGGIHADGYMDTVDALSSHAPREKKLEILKDSHSGAFAVIYLFIFLVLQGAALYFLFEKGKAEGVCFSFVLSRALSGFLALNMKNARGKGMLMSFISGASRKTGSFFCLAQGAAALSAVFLFSGIKAFALLLGVCLLWTAFYLLTAYKNFGGATGDTAGFFLTVCELLCAFALCAEALL